MAQLISIFIKCRIGMVKQWTKIFYGTNLKNVGQNIRIPEKDNCRGDTTWLANRAWCTCSNYQLYKKLYAGNMYWYLASSALPINWLMIAACDSCKYCFDLSCMMALFLLKMYFLCCIFFFIKPILNNVLYIYIYISD